MGDIARAARVKDVRRITPLLSLLIEVGGVYYAN